MTDKGLMLFAVFSGIRFLEKNFIIDSEVLFIPKYIKNFIIVDFNPQNYIFLHYPHH